MLQAGCPGVKFEATAIDEGVGAGNESAGDECTAAEST